MNLKNGVVSTGWIETRKVIMSTGWVETRKMIMSIGWVEKQRNWIMWQHLNPTLNQY